MRLFTKNILIYVVGLISIITLAALYHFDRFSFSATTGQFWFDVRGELKDNVPIKPETPIASGTDKNSVLSHESNKTEGAQSPIQHVVGGTTINNYGTR